IARLLSQCACPALRQASRLLPVEADLHALHVFESPDDGVLGLDVWMSHGDKVAEMPAGFHILASTPSC
ncbi:hypothetical protein ACLBPW_31300, partial [Klebsiella pneumoniae]|uniref:hypothetical protein n=1 Tax=Klebsiella pneumoniae TaxID=573 RepID=UPI003968927E